VTLEDIRWVFSDSDAEPPKVRRRKKKEEGKKADPELNIEETEQEENDEQKNMDQVSLLLDKDDKPDFEAEVRELMDAWFLTNVTEVVRKAVRFSVERVREARKAGEPAPGGKEVAGGE